MKWRKLDSLLLVLTACFCCLSVLGSLAVTQATAYTDERIVRETPAPNVETAPTPPPDETIVDDKFPFRLMETGDGFHGDEIAAKTGEVWLGLFKRGNTFALESTKVKVRNVHDPIVDEHERQKTGKSVATVAKGTTVFLLKNAPNLTPGPIESVFSSDDPTGTELVNGTQHSFAFRGSRYSLRVENQLSAEKFLSKGSKLILSLNGQEQVLQSLDEGCNDCFWNLFWVGDIDRDGKLDFYFDLSPHYNVMSKQLFLSSAAETDEFVHQVARFWTVGC